MNYIVFSVVALVSLLMVWGVVDIVGTRRRVVDGNTNGDTTNDDYDNGDDVESQSITGSDTAPPIDDDVSLSPSDASVVPQSTSPPSTIIVADAGLKPGPSDGRVNTSTEDSKVLYELARDLSNSST